MIGSLEVLAQGGEPVADWFWRRHAAARDVIVQDRHGGMNPRGVPRHRRIPLSRATECVAVMKDFAHLFRSFAACSLKDDRQNAENGIRGEEQVMRCVAGEAGMQIKGEVGVGLHQSTHFRGQGSQRLFFNWNLPGGRRRGIAIAHDERQAGCRQQTEAHPYCRSACRRHLSSTPFDMRSSSFVYRIKCSRKTAKVFEKAAHRTTMANVRAVYLKPITAGFCPQQHRKKRASRKVSGEPGA
jgi:hypothetical protein